MNTAEKTLVLILSAALAVLLVLAIIAIIKVIKILKQVNRLTDKAEHVAESAESMTAAFKKGAGSFVIGRLVMKMLKKAMGSKTTANRRHKGES